MPRPPILLLPVLLLVAISARAETTNMPARARVFVAGDGAATSAFVPDPAIVRHLVERGLVAFAGKPTPKEAWKSLLSPKDTAGFKVTSAPGALIGTRPAVVEALIRSLIDAGHPPRKIVVWDREMQDLRAAGFVDLARRLGVRAASSTEAGWNPARHYESPVSGKLVFGDLEFGKGDRFTVGRKSFVSRLLTDDITRIITVAPVLSHNAAGVNGHLVSLAFGSIDNFHRFAADPARTTESVPEICALDDLVPKVAFGVSDALVCQVRGDEVARLHDTVAQNEIRFSDDLVALDVLSLGDLAVARRAYPVDGEKPVKTDLYLNAELLELGLADTNRIDIVRVP